MVPGNVSGATPAAPSDHSGFPSRFNGPQNQKSGARDPLQVRSSPALLANISHFIHRLSLHFLLQSAHRLEQPPILCCLMSRSFGKGHDEVCTLTTLMTRVASSPSVQSWRFIVAIDAQKALHIADMHAFDLGQLG